MYLCSTFWVTYCDNNNLRTFNILYVLTTTKTADSPKMCLLLDLDTFHEFWHLNLQFLKWGLCDITKGNDTALRLWRTNLLAARGWLRPFLFRIKRERVLSGGCKQRAKRARCLFYYLWYLIEQCCSTGSLNDNKNISKQINFTLVTETTAPQQSIAFSRGL